MEKFLFVVLMFLISQIAFPQNTLTGIVTDSLQKPLVYANVMAKPLDSLEEIEFSITDESGRYQLELKSIPYIITANSMGYQAYSFEVDLNGEERIRNITLKVQAEQLTEVVVEIPILVKKDTIVYNVDRLTTGDERKLKDVLKKLPGVEVSKEGVVKVQGKKVSTVLVENKKFFGGGSKLAVDNIPANALDQIEIIDNYSEIPLLKDLVDSKEMAMNIKLKEDKKNFVFGDIKAGKANQDYYNAQSNLFYYSPKTTLNFIANLNNIANEVFTYQQYFDFQGGLNQTFRKGNTAFELPNDDFLQFIERQDGIKSDRKFAAINITKEVNTKLNIAAYGVFSDTKEGTLVQSSNRYNTFTEQKDMSSSTDNLFAIGNLEVAYLPNLTDAWYFKTKFKKTENTYLSTINSVVDTTDNIFLTNQSAEGSFFNQSVEWHRKSSKKHTFSFALNYTYEQGSPFKKWQTDDLILQGILPVIQDSLYVIQQHKRTRTNKLDAFLKHYWVLNKNHHIYSTLGNTYYGQSFFNRDRQMISDGSINDFTGFGNDLDFNLNDLFLGVNYKFRQGIFTFNQGIFLHYYQWKLYQDSRVDQDRFVLLPNLSVEMELDRLRKLTFNYEGTSSFSDISNYVSNYYLRSYNSVYRGNTRLKNEYYHNLSLRYSKYSGYKGIRLYLMAKYVSKTKGVIEEVEYSEINQLVSPVFVDNPERRWNFFGNIKKKIYDINLSLGLNYSNTHYKQRVNALSQTNKNSSVSYNIGAKTLFDDFPTLEVGFKQNFGSYTLSENKTEFKTSEPFINLDYDFLNGFILSCDYTAYKYSNESLNQINTYELSNASLFYQKQGSPWSFEIEARNIFDVRFKNQNSFTSYIITDRKTYIMPRIIMFSVIYNL